MGLSTSLYVTHDRKIDFQKTIAAKFGFTFSEWNDGDYPTPEQIKCFEKQQSDSWKCCSRDKTKIEEFKFMSKHHHDRFTAERSPNFVRMMSWLGKNNFYGINQDTGTKFKFDQGNYTYSNDEDIEYALKDQQHTRKELEKQNIKPEFIELMLKREKEIVIDEKSSIE